MTWQQRAWCASDDAPPADTWFAPDAEGQAYAARLCVTRCPVVDECAAAAPVSPIGTGVWGGLTEAQRRRGVRRRAVR